MSIKNLEKISNHSICMQMGLKTICDDKQHKYRNKDDPMREAVATTIKDSVTTARRCRVEYLRVLTDSNEIRKCITCEFNPENYIGKLALYRDE